MIHRPDELWKPGHPIPRRPVYPPQRHFPGWIHGACECCAPPTFDTCLDNIEATLTLDASSNCCIVQAAWESFVDGTYTVAGDGESFDDGPDVYCKYKSCFSLGNPGILLREYSDACITLLATTNHAYMDVIVTIWKLNRRVRSIRVTARFLACGAAASPRLLFVYGTEASPGVYEFGAAVPDEATCGQIVFFAEHVTDGTGTVTIAEP